MKRINALSKVNRFKKLLMSYFLVIFIPLLIISFIYIRYSSIESRNEYIDLKKNQTQNMKHEMETLFQSAQDISIQMSFMPTLNKVLTDPFNSNVYDYMVLREDLNSYVHTNPLIKSIYVYLKLNDRVITTSEGIYDREEFFDKELLDYAITNENNFNWFSLRQIPDYFVNEEHFINVLSFTTPIPFTRTESLGVLVINIDASIVYDLLEKSNFYNFSNVFIANSDGKIIVHKNEDLIGMNMTDVYPFQNGVKENLNQAERLSFNGEQYYGIYNNSELNNWTYVSLVPINNINEVIKKQIIQVAIVLFSALIIGLLLSYFFSVRMHSAWRHLFIKLGNYLQIKEINENSEDEYYAVNNAIENLLEYNKDISEIIESTKPIIRQNTISDLLLGNAVAEENNEKIELSGLNFVYKHFAALLVHLDSEKAKGTPKEKGIKKIYCLKVLEQSFEKYSQAYGVILDQNNLAFILNFPQSSFNFDLRNAILSQCKHVCDKINDELNINLLISVGTIVDDINKLNGSYVQARKRLNYKAVFSKNDVIFSSNQNDLFAYPVAIEKEIILGIKTANKEQVVSAVDSLFSDYIDKNKGSYENIQEMIFVLVGSIISTFWNEGIHSEQIKTINSYNIITQSENLDMLKSGMLKFFLSIIDEQQSENQYVESAMLYIHANYTKDISVNDIAEYVGLHPTYLGRVFRTSYGKTLINYLSYYRIEKAKELFKDNKLSLKKISQLVGFNDVHSFIRYFKKYEGITPGQYRG